MKAIPATDGRSPVGLLDHLLGLVRAPQAEVATALHEHVRLRTPGGEELDGRDAVLAWADEWGDLLRTLDVKVEWAQAGRGQVSADLWATSGTHAWTARVDLGFDSAGRLAQAWVRDLAAADRTARGIRVEVDPPIARIVLDRAEKRNAVSQPMLRTMTDAVRAFGARSDLRVVVLRGLGPSFCAGEDVRGFDFPDEDAARRFLEGPLTFFEELEMLRVPVLVAVHGAALGFGSEVLLVVDGVVADPAATLGFAEIDHGAVPSVLVSRGLGVLGRRRVADLALTGRRITASDALAAGLVHAVADDPVAEVEAIARQVSEWSPQALATIQDMCGAEAAEHHGRARDFMPRVLTGVEVSLP